jgi:hypothetical protein
MKYERKISGTTGYFILLGQKFVGMFVTKIMLSCSLPSDKDGCLFFLLALHFLSFLFCHSEAGRVLMKKYKKNHYRRVV